MIDRIADRPIGQWPPCLLVKRRAETLVTRFSRRSRRSGSRRHTFS